MNEAELAEKFNLELDAVMAGAEPAFSPDPGAMALAAAFVRTDFSGDSLIKESLRSRIACRPGLLEVLRGLLANNYARAAFAAAVLVIALLPLARRQPGPAPENALPQAVSRSVAELPPLPPPVRVKLPGRQSPGAGLFASLPMPRLQTEPLTEFPIGPAGSGLPMVLTKGRPITQGGAAMAVLETESAPFPIERRPISPEDIFERRTL